MASGELQAGFTGPAGIGRAGPPIGNWEAGGQTASQKYPELIADAAEVEADLIVVGNKGMTGVRRVLGSVPNSVAHSAPCSVLIAFTKA